ncbi:hypothetical protein KIN20_010565 [Parelaphostrongylus tenuis]|uniref:C20G8.02-like WWE domain-containing protein n=1 Tax=Parelaphostrongylus tenuis TaxID=148309 RepID=A0AAD5MQR9_PARTN|nr:hypothetical protein KIN20_010565 [Parelaphostrongylus tenuis]
MHEDNLNPEQVTSTPSSSVLCSSEISTAKEGGADAKEVRSAVVDDATRSPNIYQAQSTPHDTEKDGYFTAGNSPPTPVPPARTKKKKVTEFRCSDVRWFHRRSDADKWTNFNGRDSLILEAKYRTVFGVPMDDQMTVELLERGLTSRHSVVVMDGLFKANDDLTKVEAIYWKGDSCEIRRGTWFSQDWQPLEPQEASNKPQLTELHLEGMEIRWSSVIDVSLSFKRGAIFRYIGWGKSQALRRGFHKEAEWSDGPPEASHLILVVHGIGQKGYENLIAVNTQQVRDGVLSAIERCYPDDKITRPVFLPIEWRSALKLDDGVTDVITLPKMSGMRNALNSTAMDIMFYQSPLYRREIVGGVVHQLNRVYSLFAENNPNFLDPCPYLPTLWDLL